MVGLTRTMKIGGDDKRERIDQLIIACREEWQGRLAQRRMVGMTRWEESWS
jgi:hypothetical protein